VPTLTPLNGLAELACSVNTALLLVPVFRKSLMVPSSSPTTQSSLPSALMSTKLTMGLDVRDPVLAPVQS